MLIEIKITPFFVIQFRQTRQQTNAKNVSFSTKLELTGITQSKADQSRFDGF